MKKFYVNQKVSTIDEDENIIVNGIVIETAEEILTKYLKVAYRSDLSVHEIQAIKKAAIQAMHEFATQITDEEIIRKSFSMEHNCELSSDSTIACQQGMYWYRDQLKRTKT